MKSFFKYTLATILGVFLTLILFFFISMGIVNSIVSSQDKATEVKPNSVFTLTLDKMILDRTNEDPIANFDPVTLESEPPIGLNTLFEAIEKAADHEMIKGIYLKLSVIQASWATVEEIRNALIEFKATGKFIYAYGDFFTQKAFYLASVADHLYLNPEGFIEWTGMRSEIMFYKEAFNKIGVEPQIIRHGKYKSAVEPFIADEMSRENEEQISLFLNRMWDNIVSSIAKSRDLDPQSIDQMATNLTTLDDLNTAVERGLIDGVKYFDEVLDDLKSLTDTPTGKDINQVSYASMKKVPKERDYRGLAKEKIAVVYAQGNIVMGEADESRIGSERISRAIRKARRDSSIKAIVFRMNSGGGSALASEAIWRELKLAAEEKPVIASMGDLAASGGYYSVVPADKILASPNTLTGSIGVFAILINSRELLNDKLGIKREVVKTNPSADFPSLFRKLTPVEKRVLQNSIENVYETFITHVAEGRDLDKSFVDSIGQGRVWNAQDALELGLIDELGGLKDAIQIAVDESGVENYRIVELPKLDDPIEILIKRLTGDMEARSLKSKLGEFYRVFKHYETMIENQGVQARIPFSLDIQ